uniref:WGS project CAEQ00000000 data, annotated contig 2165 n=1 Tax=Trypanosoma congolense (strain IL3000) TaxID=1068625 RepID=F9WC02_TRYCI|nr:unnamed protein product [Trypanosoma congolense IL3000]
MNQLGSSCGLLGGTQLNPTDPYEWTRALFDEVWEPTAEGAGEMTSGNTLAETSPRHSQPIPQQLIRQWVNYVAFCRWFITHKIDWREVFSFLDDTKDVAKGSSVCPSEQNSQVLVETPPAGQDAPSLGTASARGHGETSGLHSSSEVSASFNELRRVVTFKCTKLFGESPLYIHQQRLLRWTKMLVQCIVLRLRYASQGAKGENVCLISDEELRSYKLVFVRGRDVVGMASYIRPLGRLLEMRSDAVEGRSTLATGDIQISTERGSNGATPDTTLSMNFSPGTPSQTLSPNITSLVVRSLEALWVDNLSVSWDVMDPDDIPKRVRTRLLGPMSSNESNYMDFSPIRGEPLKRPYSATFRPMFNNPVNCEGTCAMDVERIPIVVAIHLHQEKTLELLKVVRLLEIAGYVMLTKARKLCEHKCYCILPFLDDYIALRNIVRDSLSVLSRSSASDPLRLTDPEPLQVNMLKITNILLFGLLALTKHLYEQCIRRLVSKHAGKASRTMLNFSVNSSAAEMGTEAQSASPMCIFVLETVVEPTLCILQLWVLSDDFHSSEGGGCGRFVLNILQTSINTVLGNASKMRMGSRAREQLQNDHNLLIRYIVSHPVYSRLQVSTGP